MELKQQDILERELSSNTVLSSLPLMDPKLQLWRGGFCGELWLMPLTLHKRAGSAEPKFIFLFGWLNASFSHARLRQESRVWSCFSVRHWIRLFDPDKLLRTGQQRAWNSGTYATPGAGNSHRRPICASCWSASAIVRRVGEKAKCVALANVANQEINTWHSKI